MKNRHVLTGKAHHFGSFWGSLQFGETCFFFNGKPPWVHVIPSLPNAAPAGQVLPTSSRPGAVGGTIGCHWNITISSIILNLSTVWLPATARWFSMILLQHPLGDINMAVSGRPDLTSCPQGYLVLATLNHVGWVQNGAIRWEKPSGHPGSNPHLPPWKGTPIYQGEDSQLADEFGIGCLWVLQNTTLLLSLL